MTSLTATAVRISSATRHPLSPQEDGELWSGCISGSFREDLFLKAFEDAGFYAIRILKRDEKPWQTIEGVEFRAVTVEAYKGKEGPCLERCQAVIYKGPWRSVTDDDGHTLSRGQRMAVCDKTFDIYKSEPYRQDIEPVEPYEDVRLSEAAPFNCRKEAVRHPRDKGDRLQRDRDDRRPLLRPRR